MKAESVVRLRPAELADSDRLFAWQTEPNARQYFHNTAVPSRHEHESWFARRLTMNDPRMWIIEASGQPVGYVRLDPTDGQCEMSVSIMVSSSGRKGGYAGAALRLLRQLVPNDRFVAEVRSDNLVSQRLFESVGYVRAAEHTYVNDPA